MVQIFSSLKITCSQKLKINLIRLYEKINGVFRMILTESKLFQLHVVLFHAKYAKQLPSNWDQIIFEKPWKWFFGNFIWS